MPGQAPQRKAVKQQRQAQLRLQLFPRALPAAAVRRLAFIQRRAQQPGAQQRRQRQRGHVHEGRMRQRPCAFRRPIQPGQQRQRRHRLQSQPEGAREPARLAHTHPESRRALQRPGQARGPRIQRQRRGQRDKAHAQRHEARAHQMPAPARCLTHAGQPAPQHQIRHAKAQRRPGRAVFQMPHHARLQGKAGQRHAKNQRGIHHGAARRRLLRGAQAGIQQRHGHVNCHERQQKWLRRAPLWRRVAQHAPNRGNAEGRYRPQPVRLAPGAPRRNGRNAQPQQRVVAKQRHVAALPC